ncbi:MAG TPA: DEAD/DEAH box helicase family protein [Bacillales bacterium]|nr:DEAD/DEAH box helicase family protein [Bacillales bacterium]
MSKSGIRDNRKRGSVGEYLKNHTEKDSELLFLSAYFTVYAYEQLKGKLNAIKSMKFLFGEPTFIKQKNILESRNFNINPLDMEKRENSTNDNVAYGISLDARLRQSAISKDCVEWIKEKVEVKSLVKPNFLHGKLYHITQSNGREYSIMGSSNFTYNGLGFGDSKNIELNLVTDSNRDISDLKDWFLELWNDKQLTVDVKEDVIEFLEQYYKENSPEFLYYFTLYHLFKDYLDENISDLFNEDYKESKIWNMLFDFQKNAVQSALNKLKKYNGCIIADSVGLGKTFEALAIIKYYELVGKKVLVLCPKKLSENWRLFTEHDERNFLRSDGFRYAVRYHTDLAREGKHVDGSNLGTFTWEDFDLVVIDESHNFRNNRSSKKITRYEWLFENVIKKGRKTQVLMLSATPVNNRLTDLRNQISLATKGDIEALKEEGIKNIDTTLREAQKIFNDWTKTPEKNRKVKKLIEELSNTDFIRLLDSFTIARSRKHIREHFDIASVGGFPERLKPLSVFPKIDVHEGFITYEEINDMLDGLNLAILSPFAYLKEEVKKEYHEKYDTVIKGKRQFTQEDRESHLIGMMKVNYLKRLESSIHSFNLSISRLKEKIEMMINLYDSQFEYVDSVLDESEINYLETEDDIDEELFIGKKIRIPVTDIDVHWKNKLQEDLVILNQLYSKTKMIDADRDNKLFKLKQILRGKVKHNQIDGEVINKDNKKVIVFTAYSDTADYIYESLKGYCMNDLNVHIGLVVGSGSCKATFKPPNLKSWNEFNTILTNFSPVSKYRSSMGNMPQKGEIEILIATDCISEGQNLQDCDCVINYDIHWNPVKLLQRFGRIDRISGSERKNQNVKLVNFWATDDLNKYIKLNERVRTRMTIVDITATGDEGDFLDEQQAEKYTMNFREKQLLRMKEEILDIEDLYQNVSLTEFNFNDFRMDILNYIKSEFNSFDSLPLGLYAVCPSNLKEKGNTLNGLIKPGIIFCIKRKVSENTNRKSNPIEPYYLLYIHNSGNIAVGFSNAKEILSIYRLLCLHRTEPIEELCKLFNNLTNNCSDMGQISKLLDAVISGIREEAKKTSQKTLRFDRSLKSFTSENRKKDTDDIFELVSFLILS